MNEADRAFHQSLKPSWGPDGTLVYAAPPSSKPFGRSSRRIREKEGLLSVLKGGIVSSGADIRFAKFANEVNPKNVSFHAYSTDQYSGFCKPNQEAEGYDYH